MSLELSLRVFSEKLSIKSYEVCWNVYKFFQYRKNSLELKHGSLSVRMKVKIQRNTSFHMILGILSVTSTLKSLIKSG